MRRFFFCCLKLFFILAVLSLVGTAAGLGWVYYLVAKAPCPEMSQESIASILGRESPVFYRDGQEKIGVLFEEIHRQYLTYDQIPKNFVNAIVAAEDGQFFQHYGIDFPGIARAVYVNFKAGRVVQGGSTITQQTAKNLFKRQSRSYEAKLKETLYALRLEYYFSKEKILEFYCNQFYVSGNGHGLGVAARYYFDKNPADLTLLETAFIAGSVKRPNYYNPFIRKSKTDALKARIRAQERAEYVLANMLKLNMIGKAEHDAAKTGEIMFNQGKTSYALNTIMDTVQDGLSSKLIAEALAQHGISNIATSGARIITTLDRALQTETLYSLRRELSRLDVCLRGYVREEVQTECKYLEGDSEVAEKAFVFGTIKNIDLSSPDKPAIAVSFGPDQPGGLIDRQGLERMLTALVRNRKSRWATPGKKDLAELLEQLKTGDRVYVSVREIDLFDHTPTLDLERYPKIQGAALVLQQGRIRAMAGGVENRFFNRAVDAKRPMGSTFKPFLYAAALQLGWSPLDQLDNRRNVFVFLDQAYFPRPDHKSPFAQVSMSWAGVKSENVASVWLLYHLTDRLTQPQLLELAAALGMTQQRDETYEQFRARMQAFGIRLAAKDIDQAAYEQAVQKLEPDFTFEGRWQEYRELKDMPYGLNFSKFRADIYGALKKKKLDAEERSELWRQLSLLGGSYLGFRSVRQRFDSYRQYLEQPINPMLFFNQAPEAEDNRPAGALLQDQQGQLIYALSSSPSERWQPVNEFFLRARLAGLTPAQKEMLWNSVLLEGKLSVRGMSLLERQMKAERDVLASGQPYSPEVLTAVKDYRVMVGLQYLIRLAREAGVSGELAPVLSFPLGSNVISLFDSVRIYEAIVTGNHYDAQQPKESGAEEMTAEEQAGLAAIERIEGPDGRVIYARQDVVNPVLDPKTSSETANILQNVVRYGTGHYAWENVRLHTEDQDEDGTVRKMDISLPLLGKTGTANDFRNAAFIGYVPVEVAPDRTALLAASGYAAGVYVGFDDNDPMKSGSTRLSGAQGALPTWADIAAALYRLDRVADRLDAVDLVFNGIGLQYPDTGPVFIPVDDQGGGLMRRGMQTESSLIAPEEPAVLSHGAEDENGNFVPERRFQPFWLIRQAQAAPPAN